MMETTGIEQLLRLVTKVNGLKLPIADAMHEIGEKWIQIIRDGMANSSSPSEPGSFPGVVTGTLSASFIESSVSWQQVTISTSVEYAQYLQEGTSKMTARPFFEREEVNEELIKDGRNLILSRVGAYLNV